MYYYYLGNQCRYFNWEGGVRWRDISKALVFDPYWDLKVSRRNTLLELIISILIVTSSTLSTTCTNYWHKVQVGLQKSFSIPLLFHCSILYSLKVPMVYFLSASHCSFGSLFLFCKYIFLLVYFSQKKKQKEKSLP